MFDTAGVCVCVWRRMEKKQWQQQNQKQHHQTMEAVETKKGEGKKRIKNNNEL